MYLSDFVSWGFPAESSQKRKIKIQKFGYLKMANQPPLNV
jgi:hypothetical protein